MNGLYEWTHPLWMDCDNITVIIALYIIAKSPCSFVHKQTQPWLVFAAGRLKYSRCWKKPKVSENNFIFGFIKEIKECQYSHLLHYHTAYKGHIHLWLLPEPASACRSELVNRAVQTIGFSMTDCWITVLKIILVTLNHNKKWKR